MSPLLSIVSVSPTTNKQEEQDLVTVPHDFAQQLSHYETKFSVLLLSDFVAQKCSKTAQSYPGYLDEDDPLVPK